MQWNDTAAAGFSEGKPWLAVNENYNELNVEEQETRPDSVLNYFRRMIQLRKQCLTLVYGAFELVDENNNQIFAYTRELDNQKLMVVLNFSDTQATLNADIDVAKRVILIGNYELASNSNLYRPYEAVVYDIQL
jgi:oligo-1,6-glucosidase